MGSPYEREAWIPVCRWCQKREPLKGVLKQGSSPPNDPPDMPGVCNASPTGKHGPMWEKY